MSVFFIVLMAVYGFFTLWTNRRGEISETPHPPTWGVILLQTPLFLVACYLAWARGAFSRDLVSPVSIGAGIVLGHVVFAFSVLATHKVWRDALTHFADVKMMGWFLKESPDLLLRFFGVALTEEIIYRAAAQPVLTSMVSSVPLAVVLTAFVFSVVHKHFFRNSFSLSLEFLVFAVLLGALYYWTNSLILVVMVHAVRNLESIYLEYLQKLDELGDEQQALRALEDTYRRRSMEPT